MVGVVIRPAPADHPFAEIFNPVAWMLRGDKGGRIKLWGDDGVETNTRGTQLSVSNHALIVRSDTPNHVRVRNSGDTADIVRIEDGGLLHDAGTYSRWYSPTGVNYGQIAADNNGKLNVTGLGSSSGIMAATAFEASGWVSIGAAPAQSRALRLTNNEVIAWRNGANSGDAAAILMDPSDILFVGHPTSVSSTVVRALNSVVIQAGGASVVTATTTLVMVPVATLLGQVAHPASTSAGFLNFYAATDTFLYKRTPAGVSSSVLDTSRFTGIGQLLFSPTSNSVTALSLGTTWQELVVNATTAPMWTSGVLAVGTTIGALFYGPTAHAVTQLTLGASGTFLKAAASAPTWAAFTASDITANAITQRPAVAVGTGVPTTSTTAILAFTSPTLTIVTAGGDVDIEHGLEVGGSTAAVISLYLRVDSGAWTLTAETGLSGATDRDYMSGFERFSGLAATSHLFEMGWTTSAGTATGFANARRMKATEIKK